MKGRRKALPIIMLFLLCAGNVHADRPIFGDWRFDADRSTQMAPWQHREPRLEIRGHGDAITIVQHWRHRGRGSWSDSVTVDPGGEPTRQTVSSPIWPMNWFMGVLAKVGSERTTRAVWVQPGRRLRTEIEQVVEISQGETTLVTTCEYSVDARGDRMTLVWARATRPAPLKLVFDRVAGDHR